jgi:hypothetical protein
VCACAGAPQSVKLGAPWPDKPSAYEAAHDRWTRHGSHSADMMQVIDAFATLASPEFRLAYVTERARRTGLPPADADALVAAERAAADDSWEVELVVATGKAAWNDFHKPARSMWRVALAGDDGREVVPESVREDKRPRAAIAEYFPDLGPFHRAYIVRFPKVGADGRPLVAGDASRLTLKIGSDLVKIEMSWGP